MAIFWCITYRHQLRVEEGRVRCHYVKNIESKLVVGSDEGAAAASLLTLYGNNIEEYDKEDIITNIEFEAIVPSIKKYFIIVWLIL